MASVSSKEDIEKGLKLGAADFMIKSQFDLDEVITKIKKLIYFHTKLQKWQKIIGKNIF